MNGATSKTEPTGKPGIPEKRVRATGDLAFKKVFGTVGNEGILAGLADDFFGFEPKGVVITNPYDVNICDMIIRSEGEERSRLIATFRDVGAEFANGGLMAEMQAEETGLLRGPGALLRIQEVLRQLQQERQQIPGSAERICPEHPRGVIFQGRPGRAGVPFLRRLC